MDITDTKAHMEGLNQKIKNLRADRDKFMSAKSTDEQIVKSQTETNEAKELLTEQKADLNTLKAKKADSLKFTIVSMEEKLSEMLPYGSAVVEIRDGSMSIGWQLPGGIDNPEVNGVIEYESLSKGQQKIFEQALTRAMLDKGGLLVYECGEVDSDNVKALMKTIKGKPYQIILNAWKRPVAMKDWVITPR